MCNVRTKTRILKATVMSVITYGSEARAFRKTEEYLLDFSREIVWIVLSTRLTDRMRWLVHGLRMKDDRLPKIVLFGTPSRAKRKAVRPCLGWKELARKDLREMRTS